MNEKVVLIITMYRLPDGSGQEMYTVKAQMDYKKGRVKLAKQYQDKMIAGISQYIDKQMKIDNIIIVGDLNKDINSIAIRQLFIEKGLFNIYEIMNLIKETQWESTCKYSVKCVNAIATTAGLLQYVDGCEMIESNELIVTDYRGYLINFNLERYFECKQFVLDDINSLKLDSRWASHKKLFVEKVEEYMD